jgi:predicted adenylyl cyclase CyaB
MSFLNIEIKAYCSNPEQAENYLLQEGARFAGLDTQEDIYFHVPEGRLKLRRGPIENNLIFYRRTNQEGPKASEFILHPVQDSSSLQTLLTQALGVKVIVRKNRKIFYLHHTKFHIDEVPGLGHFVEIEVSNLHHPHLEETQMQNDCREYMSALGIKEEDLVAVSYSDMLLEQASGNK